MKILSMIAELLQIQSVYYSTKNKDDNDDIFYYPQVLIEQFGYGGFSNKKIIHPDLVFTDTEPNESEEEFNEDTVCDE